MKLNKKFTIFVALLALLYCVSLIQDTYAKYLTSADASTNIGISRWSVIVNTQDVTQNNDFTSTLTPTFNGNDNISAGILAPTATGYFDIVVDGSESDVPFAYTINISGSDAKSISDYNIIDYTIDGDSYEYEGDLTGNILLDDEVKSHTIRVNTSWIDGDDENMNNTDDTDSIETGNGNFIVNVQLSQLSE